MTKEQKEQENKGIAFKVSEYKLIITFTETEHPMIVERSFVDQLDDWIKKDLPKVKNVKSWVIINQKRKEIKRDDIYTLPA